MNDLVQFTDDRDEKVEFRAKDVRDMLCPNATAQELALFLELCQRQKLNPFVKDAYLVKYGNAPATMITAKDVFVRRANRNPLYEGIEHGIVYLCNKQVSKREGAAVYKVAGEQLIGGWARVYIKGKRPVYAELALDEYSTGKSNWAKMPAVMIDKCAQVAALRLAFPEDFGGLYIADEMRQVQDAAPVEVEPLHVVEPEPAVEVDPEQEAAELDRLLVEFGELCDRFAAMKGKSQQEVYAAVMATKTMQATGASETAPMDRRQVEVAIAVVSSWVKRTKGGQAQEVEQLENAEGVDF